MNENSVNISGNGVNGKNNFWQIIRGICILAVVMIHCPAGSDYAAGSIQFNTWLIIRQFINFPVAVFVFLSGYFTNAEKIQGKTRTYVLKRGGDYSFRLSCGPYFTARYQLPPRCITAKA